MRLPQKPPQYVELLKGVVDTDKLLKVMRSAGSLPFDGRYLHWDDLKYRTPPDGLTVEEWWLGLKMQRTSASREIPLKDTKGTGFRFNLPDLITDLLHQIDRGAGTILEISEQVATTPNKDRYVMRSLMEEAITSSQLEGAATTRDVAKKMLAEGRKPRDPGERMIFNNFAAIRRIVELKEKPLTPDMVFEIHREISEGALDVADGAGRFRRGEEDIKVADITGTIFHVPPPADELPRRLEEMCAFANEKTPGFFIHPVVRGIILHFWLAYDHPFADGNGRTARALFYWQMLHKNYWLFEFISISQFLRRAPVQYGTAFLHTETDDNDLTYFILHQATIIKRALEELHDYLARKSVETSESLAALENHPGLNHRQALLVQHAVRNPNTQYSIVGHLVRQAVTYATARADLLGLTRMGLLAKRKSGRAFVFHAPKDLRERLASPKRPARG